MEHSIIHRPGRTSANDKRAAATPVLNGDKIVACAKREQGSIVECFKGDSYALENIASPCCIVLYYEALI